MAKKQPPGTKGHTLFLPDELHEKVKTLAAYGEADDLILECLAEAIEPRWKKWLRLRSEEAKKSH